MDLATLVLIILGLGLLVGLFAIRGVRRPSPAAVGDGYGVPGGTAAVGRDTAMPAGAGTNGHALDHGSHPSEAEDTTNAHEQGHGCC
jgi:hypothetical protein